MSEFILPDGKIYYNESGSGPTLLLIHAGIADSRMWNSVIDRFYKRFRVIRCDLRGYGESDLPDNIFSYHGDIRRLLEGLNIAPAWIVGASFGGRIAIDVALEYPDLVEGLILAAPAVGGFVPDTYLQNFDDEEERLLESGSVDAATELNLRTWVDGPFRSPGDIDPEMRTFVGHMQRHAFLKPEPANVDLEPVEPPAIERLQEIDKPTLILSGLLDVQAFVDLSSHIVETVPGAARIEFPEAAHMISMEAPDRFADETIRFINTRAR